MAVWPEHCIWWVVGDTVANKEENVPSQEKEANSNDGINTTELWFTNFGNIHSVILIRSCEYSS